MVDTAHKVNSLAMSDRFSVNGDDNSVLTVKIHDKQSSLDV